MGQSVPQIIKRGLARVMSASCCSQFHLNQRNRCVFSRRQNRVLLLLLSLLTPPATAAEQDVGAEQGIEQPFNPESIQPFPRPLIRREQLVRWDFAGAKDGWQPIHACRLTAQSQTLAIEMTDSDPYLISPRISLSGPLQVRLRCRFRGAGEAQFYWSTTQAPDFREDRVVRFRLLHDEAWHEYDVNLPVRGVLTQIRFDPGADAGKAEIDWIECVRPVYHPVELLVVDSRPPVAKFALRNHQQADVAVRVENIEIRLPAGATRTFHVDTDPHKAFSTLPLSIQFPQHDEWPAIERELPIHNAAVPTTGWLTLTDGDLALRVDPRGAGARIHRHGELVAYLQPLAQKDGRAVALQFAKDAGTIRGQGKGISAYRLSLDDGVLSVEISSAESEIEAPIVHVLGDLEQGLLAGVEYLGRDEHSSSRKDIRSAEHIRFAPPMRSVTTPLMGFVTKTVSVFWQWNPPSARPVFATPNFIDGLPTHRMSLRGRRITGALRVGAGWDEAGRLADAIHWHLKTYGLPEPVTPPRAHEEQLALCLAALRGPLAGPQGWQHAAGERWPHRFYASHASTIFRLAGELPRTPQLVGGGAHVENPAAYLLSGRARGWLDDLAGRAAAARQQQAEDGLFHYRGRFREGHFEDTASGYCARSASMLLDHAWYTGDPDSLSAGLRALAAIRRFRTPRGAQTWEVPLHTPDILAAAHLVHGYVRAFEMTGDEAYLNGARRWALTGVPFVYAWADRPIMLYATTPVLGATNWEAPNWIGLPVQWCGLSYAYALVELAPHDAGVDWSRVARGILHTAEQMQYPAGSSVGCLPDAFELDEQVRRPADINPCVLVALRLKLAGLLDGVAVASNERFRVAAPFPAELQGDEVTVQGRAGQQYQLAVNGDRIIDVSSRGVDRVRLAAE